MIIYYNPECSKCREAVVLLEQNSCGITLREYLKEPPTEEELNELLGKLGCQAIDIVRKTEPLYLEKFGNAEMTHSQWIRVLSENPVLIERPIIIDGERALIGRPPLLALELVKKKS